MLPASFSFLNRMPPDMFFFLSPRVPEQGAGAGFTKQEAEVFQLLSAQPGNILACLKSCCSYHKAQSKVSPPKNQQRKLVWCDVVLKGDSGGEKGLDILWLFSDILSIKGPIHTFFLACRWEKFIGKCSRNGPFGDVTKGNVTVMLIHPPPRCFALLEGSRTARLAATKGGINMLIIALLEDF